MRKKSIAICVKMQEKTQFSKYSIWERFSVGNCDRNALNVAIAIKEKTNCYINLYAMAPMKYKAELNSFFEYGIDHVYHISDKKFVGSDSLGTSKVLASSLLQNNEKIVLFGGRSDDSSTSQVPIQVSGLMQIDYYDDLLYDLNLELLSELNQDMVLAIYKEYDDIFPKIGWLLDAEKKSIEHITHESISLSNDILAFTEVVSAKRMEINSNKLQRCVTDSKEALRLIGNVCMQHGGGRNVHKW